MKQRRFGKTNKMVSEIGLGTWQLGRNGVNRSIIKRRWQF